VRLSDREKAAIGAAASSVGMAVAAWLGRVAMDAVWRAEVPVLYRDLIAELTRASVLLEKALSDLPADSQASRQAASSCIQAAQRVDALVQRIDRALGQ